MTEPTTTTGPIVIDAEPSQYPVMAEFCALCRRWEYGVYAIYHIDGQELLSLCPDCLEGIQHLSLEQRA